ncbi:MAG: pro-sigmaK processing inhibitor BofA family protein [Clostridia bacterium]|nr:pro-sigmaK processing inhibitor BofA family protein [Clostridia bacterium]
MPLMKVIFRIIYNGILGGIAIVLLNLGLGLFGYQLALNVFTALIAGFLGLPGIVLIAFLQNMFKL